LTEQWNAMSGKEAVVQMVGIGLNGDEVARLVRPWPPSIYPIFDQDAALCLPAIFVAAHKATASDIAAAIAEHQRRVRQTAKDAALWTTSTLKATRDWCAHVAQFNALAPGLQGPACWWLNGKEEHPPSVLGVRLYVAHAGERLWDTVRLPALSHTPAALACAVAERFIRQEVTADDWPAGSWLTWPRDRRHLTALAGPTYALDKLPFDAEPPYHPDRPGWLSTAGVVEPLCEQLADWQTAKLPRDQRTTVIGSTGCTQEKGFNDDQRLAALVDSVTRSLLSADERAAWPGPPHEHYQQVDTRGVERIVTISSPNNWHWVVCIIDRPKRTIWTRNSLLSLTNVMKAHVEVTRRVCARLWPAVKDYQVREQQTQQQTNGWDCGVLALQNMLLALPGHEASDWPTVANSFFRHKLALWALAGVGHDLERLALSSAPTWRGEAATSWSALPAAVRQPYHTPPVPYLDLLSSDDDEPKEKKKETTPPQTKKAPATLPAPRDLTRFDLFFPRMVLTLKAEGLLKRGATVHLAVALDENLRLEFALEGLKRIGPELVRSVVEDSALPTPANTDALCVYNGQSNEALLRKLAPLKAAGNAHIRSLFSLFSLCSLCSLFSLFCYLTYTGCLATPFRRSCSSLWPQASPVCWSYTVVSTSGLNTWMKRHSERKGGPLPSCTSNAHLAAASSGCSARPHTSRASLRNCGPGDRRRTSDCRQTQRRRQRPSLCRHHCHRHQTPACAWSSSTLTAERRLAKVVLSRTRP